MSLSTTIRGTRRSFYRSLSHQRNTAIRPNTNVPIHHHGNILRISSQFHSSCRSLPFAASVVKDVNVIRGSHSLVTQYPFWKNSYQFPSYSLENINWDDGSSSLYWRRGCLSIAPNFCNVRADRRTFTAPPPGSSFPHPDSIQHIYNTEDGGESSDSTVAEDSGVLGSPRDAGSAGGRTPRRRRKPNPRSNGTLNPSDSGDSTFSSSLPPLRTEEYDPQKVVDQIYVASKWNQGRLLGEPFSNVWRKQQSPEFRDEKSQYNQRKKKQKVKYAERKWDFHLVQYSVDDYERHLQFVLDHLTKISETSDSKNITNALTSAELFSTLHPIHSDPEKCEATHSLLSSSTLSNAFRALARCKIDTPLLSRRVRHMERLVGQIGWTPITENLSYRLLEANAKAGNVKRVLALLELRKGRGYLPRETKEKMELAENKIDFIDVDDYRIVFPGEKEFLHALTSIQSAQLPLRRSRNIYLHESQLSESSLDNPTRYLDAILLNMSQRGVPLRPSMAARMLNCYASTGRTGRSLHYFFRVVRHEAERKNERDDDIEEGEITSSEIFHDQEGNEDQVLMDANNDCNDETEQDGMPNNGNRKIKVQMIMHAPPPFYKIPSAVKSTPLVRKQDKTPYSFVGASSVASASEDLSSASQSSSSDATTTKASSTRSNTPQTSNSFFSRKHTHTPSTAGKTKLEYELEQAYSLSLTAAFAFADSLTHGACGHDAIELNLQCWNALIKACCYRGAFHRALRILNETMPQKGIEADSVSYNTVLAGLARVGDVTSLKEYLIKMTNKKVPIDMFTVQAMADGLLNIGDISGASTIVQDIFNQHEALPPYTTHLKIIEFALANGLVFEAKRHVYFVQQLYKWQPSKHHSKEFTEIVEYTKRNPKLSQAALQKLFRYFGEDLSEQDFF